MTGGLISAPVLQLNQVTGLPYGGAKAYFYLTGTTTPATVYQDAALSTVFASPVNADDEGRFPPIYSDVISLRVKIIAIDGDLLNPLLDIDPLSPGGSSGGGGSASKILYLSKATASGLTLAQADTLAAANDWILSIDRDYTLTGNTTLTAKLVRFDGGIVTLGNYHFIGNFERNPNTVMFNVSGTGIVKPTQRMGWISPINYGSLGNQADASLVFSHMKDTINATTKTTPFVRNDESATVSVDLGSGEYLVTTSGAMSVRAWGQKIKGAGAAVAAVYFNPGGGNGYLLKADNASQNVLEDFSVMSSDGTNDFCWLFANVAGLGIGDSDFVVRDFIIFGPWRYCFKIDGDNILSNNIWEHVVMWGGCDAFIYIPATTSYIVVNHYIAHCQWAFLDKQGYIIDCGQGGSFSVRDCTALHVNHTLFNFTQATQVEGFGLTNDLTFVVDRFEVELLAPNPANAKIINCTWPAGLIDCRHIIMSSAIRVTLNLAQKLWSFVLNSGGPQIIFRDSQLAGVFEFTAPPNPQLYTYSIKFDNCAFMDRFDPFDAGAPTFIITHDATDAVNLASLPIIRLRNRRDATPDANPYNSAAAWQAAHVYPVNTIVNINLQTWRALVGGTSGAAAPVPHRAASFAEGPDTLQWTLVDGYPYGDYVKDANIKYDGIGAILGDLEPLTCIITGPDGKTPRGNAVATVRNHVHRILPPNSKVTQLRFIIPAGVAVTATPTNYDVKSELFAQPIIKTFTTVNPSTGYDSGWVDANYNTGAAGARVADAYGSRMIQLVARADVTETIAGAFLMVRYV